MEKYIAHVERDVNDNVKVQYIKEHLDNVASMAENNCPLPYLKPIVKVAALLHDDGKIGQPFQDYMKDVIERGDDAPRRKVDHSTAGGKIIERMVGKNKIGEVIGDLVYSHHGLQDCIDMESGETLSDRRDRNDVDIDYIQKRFYEIYPKSEFKEMVLEACKGLSEENCNIKTAVNSNRAFYVGMYERMMLSVLIDSDWSDTAAFSDGTSLPRGMSQSNLDSIWENAIENFNEHMRKLESDSSRKSVLNEQRNKISDMCLKASKENCSRYRLTVPTGSGKTYSSLRFALNRALKEHKRHIFYIAPYNSILEQNADEIRSAVGNDDYVLEHHCNVVYDDYKDAVRYRKLTERWSRPIVLTTAVQILNTLFSDEKSCIRRMYNLCNSVIIFDEVQAIPVKCTDLFNLAVNFLSEFCNTTVVLCSATQPSVAAKEENEIMTCKEMAGNINQYDKYFKRTEIIDRTDEVLDGMKISDLRNFTLSSFKENGSVLVVVNTKSIARKLYKSLKNDAADFGLYHLSTNMCPENRDDVLKKIRNSLAEGRPIICVSTQLVEAGVDLSFGCVIRSLSGLDSIIQAAGRCNRHKEKVGLGKVIIIRMNNEIENISGMKEMKCAQEACMNVLRIFRDNPEILDGSLETQKAITRYYEIYQNKLKHNLGNSVMRYRVPNYDADIVDMLGRNSIGESQKERHYEGRKTMKKLPWLKQAFKTAGKEFEVISDNDRDAVVVPYGEGEKLLQELSATGKTVEIKNILRRLQRYTVQISNSMRRKLGNAVQTYSDTGILVLEKGYYNDEVGVTDEPENTGIFL